MSLLPQNTHATPTPPNNPTGGGRHGGVGGKGGSGEYGTIVEYFSDTYTSTVQTRSGIIYGVPQLRSAPGQITPLEAGTEVLVSYEFGDPIILGIITRVTKQAASGPRYSATGVTGYGGQGDNKDIRRNVGNYRAATEPDDLMPGDWAKCSPDGNSVGVYTGGVNMMRSSDLAQIRTHAVNDMVEVICRNYRQISDMGEFSIKNKAGKINMKFRGGSDQRTESGSDEENWSIKFDLGSEGDMLNLELCTPQGQTLFKFHVSADGECEIYGINGVSINSGNSNQGVSVEESSGNKVRRIQGSQTLECAGSNDSTIGGDDTTTTTGDRVVTAGNDIRYQAVRDVALGSGRTFSIAAQGSLFGDAMVFDIETGDWVVDIGGPTSLNPLSGFKMTTFNGDMDFKSLASGSFNFTSTLGSFTSRAVSAKLATSAIPDSVILGGEFITSHVVKYEQLQLLMSTLFTLLDTHIHTEASTSFAGVIPVIGVSGPPVIPVTPILTPMMLTTRSLTTGVQS
jgi:hypothetical protein